MSDDPRVNCLVEADEPLVVAEEPLHSIDGLELRFLGLDELLVGLEVGVMGNELVDVVQIVLLLRKQLLPPPDRPLLPLLSGGGVLRAHRDDGDFLWEDRDVAALAAADDDAVAEPLRLGEVDWDAVGLEEG